jgi:hypothetical protein
MKAICSVILLMILVSCGQKSHKVKSDFDLIEITYDNGWTGGYTVHIDSLGIITKCKYHIISNIDSAVCYVDTLDSKHIDSLNIKINQVKSEKIDSIYDGHCQDCGGFIIKLQYDKKTIRSMIIGSDKFYNTISSLAKYVTGLMIDKNRIDSVIVFETTKVLIPPPIDRKEKFIPPDINEIKK